ncbi:MULTISPECIES: 16S rRNA (guanine(527)-N(7))-methyltransferase RsmG [unclassified Chelatococcus]|uniref:16S rRNA (guanine(527)-N(7))-methyltransferase RsmG n=1 Tax=unclassified Chelatococcus TaxID=2638111 RepID=UPI001BD1808D|nr:MULTISPECIES: 16S rRNA (guanine(527)-N(7))-methyltransferase RsmG [unclassified Chelatococcus]CAH1657249.1 Ribosomal RNA small subunit methyltransferase G [Hyphomicrobiales bacterium]MBS7740654.1 16S rRNA (guanine(527)-N(7))-methyltransferase RsmG [Chelatococcus sp. HY11]MBX3544562.1 16S rRNA (guanine(527)-N(7))-methyltransferase RsmG [Chelatococcus sp.]MCO5079859.1 16S rRNA (guanine(527)-N(7))-methyltransferase RsmG [Chelatococcus sp.]CAH1684486.1 Ribosomal RNA small subunit methyltransfer
MASGVQKGDLEQAGLADVSRETVAKLDVYVRELQRWQSIKNLVGPGTLEDIWGRHIADSAQLLRLRPQARRWLDLGSGAGFPGLVIAILLSDTAGAEVHLVESNSRKCAFLRAAVRATGAPAKVHEGRIEDVANQFVGGIDVVTARALAPVVRLMPMVKDLLRTGSVGIFPKGQDLDAELTEASKSWRITADIAPSLTDPEAGILVVSEACELERE